MDAILILEHLQMMNFMTCYYKGNGRQGDYIFPDSSLEFHFCFCQSGIKQKSAFPDGFILIADAFDRSDYVR